jgi:FkbM family methyltransferase
MQEHNANYFETIERKNFIETLRLANDRWQQRKTSINALVSRFPLLIFGFGGKGQAIAHHIQKFTNKELWVYDTSPKKRTLARKEGFKVVDVLSSNELTRFAVILGACQAQKEQQEIVGEHHIYYQEAASFFNAPHLENSAPDFQEHVLAYSNELFDVAINLVPESYRSMLAVLSFRMSLDPADLQPIRRANNLMWFDTLSLTRSRPYDTFLDIGAFDGDTLRLFQEKFSCQRGIAVEANERLFSDIRKVSKIYSKGIEILPMAAWSKRTMLDFEVVRSGMVKVKENEFGVLRAGPIDDSVFEKVDVIKMDIEGAEAKALEGSRKLLKQWEPDLAIAAYHRPADFIRLYEQLVSYGYKKQNFEWHFAHYSDCFDDSIFYVTRKS